MKYDAFESEPTLSSVASPTFDSRTRGSRPSRQLAIDVAERTDDTSIIGSAFAAACGGGAGEQAAARASGDAVRRRRANVFMVGEL
jgi:hypothetical protein